MVAFPVSASRKTAEAAVERRSGDLRYHHSAWVSTTNRAGLFNNPKFCLDRCRHLGVVYSRFCRSGCPALLRQEVPFGRGSHSILMSRKSSKLASGRRCNEPLSVLSEGLAWVGCGTAVSRPHGFPRRVIITSSPSSMSLSILLTLDLNSLMLYVATSEPLHGFEREHVLLNSNTYSLGARIGAGAG